VNLSIFILAAGHGERLRPITDYIPKPLLPILGKPVLESVLERVSALGVNKIGINLHHKKGDIEKWVRQSAFSDRIELFPEDPVLGTGGALKNAEGLLKKSTFLVHNSDILSDIDLAGLVAYHLSSENLATLAVHDYPKFNSLVVDKKGLLKKIINHPLPSPPPSRGRALAYALSSKRKSDKNPCGGRTEPYPLSPGGRGLGGRGKFLAFTGVAVYRPEFLKILPPGVSSVVDAWRKAIYEGCRIGTFDVTGCRWTDIGTPVSYAKAVIAELRENGETVYIHPSVKGCKHIGIDGYVVVENNSILSKGASLRNCIVLQKSHVSEGTCHENCILGPGFKIDLRESDLFDTANPGTFLIGTGGSDRKYYRVRKGRRSTVLMQSHKDDPDFERQIEYTHFFRKYSVPVPELLRATTQKESASFEDLGDLSLYGWLKCPREKRQKEKVYRQLIDILVLIHTVATEHVSECPLLQNRIFDYEYLRWETDYFIERFVCGIRNIRIRNLSALKDEFHRLAARVDSFRKTIIHRDFQSQNIMMTKEKNPKILDYQGARIGPPAYDIASILWDPYYRLDDDLRERLVDYYLKHVPTPYPPFSKGGQGGIFEKEFRDTVLPCRLQRHMQALGAYGFLSSVKGKKYFLKYVPEALRLLREDLANAKKEFPLLDVLVRKL
jgi:NDP-sugar pyrophosphorylase family protein/aminoglycoside/choline kinase family phosphotransferase